MGEHNRSETTESKGETPRPWDDDNRDDKEEKKETYHTDNKLLKTAYLEQTTTGLVGKQEKGRAQGSINW